MKLQKKWSLPILVFFKSLSRKHPILNNHKTQLVINQILKDEIEKKNHIKGSKTK